MLINYFNHEEALSIVSRIKRGLKYTKNPNAFVKDYIYLDGYNKVKKFLETHEKKSLYTGIIGLNEIDEINSKTGVTAAIVFSGTGESGDGNGNAGV